MLSRQTLPGLGAALIVASCGIGAAPRPSARPAPSDAAVEVAALLPDDAERCVVARPGLVAERRRALVRLHSHAEPAAWDTELGIVAYASALAEGEGGRQVRRSYYRLASPSPELVRDVLHVRWLDEPCEGDECRRAVARWIDARTLEVARYEWPRRPLPVSSGDCVQLARESPDAIEVASRVTEQLGTIHLLRPARERTSLRVEGSSLESERELTFDDAVEARILEAQIAHGRSIESALLPLGPAVRRVERDGAQLRVRESRRWDELELAVEDERLAEQALARTAARHEPLPVARVRVDDLGSVRHQLRLRRAELARLAPDARARAAAELRDLLRRALVAHPSEASLALALARLELDVLDEPRASLAIAEDMLARGGIDERLWRALRREALARIDGAALARALAADGLASGGDAQRGAEDLAALLALGVPYEWAEGAWTSSRELLEARGPLSRANARLPLEGLLGALVGWARLGDAARHLTVQIAVRSPHAGEVRAIGETRAELVSVRAPRGGMVFVAAVPSPDLVALRRLGALLAPAIASGPLEVVVALRDPSGAHVSTLRVAGELAGDTLEIERVSEELAPAPWPLVARYLAQPLAELETALFPPPTLTVRAESAEVAAELRRSAEVTHPGACGVAGPMLRCRLPGRAEELGELLLGVAAARAALD